MFEELLRQWDGEEVVVRHDRETGTWMLICVHSTTLGPAMGGTRMKEYGSPAEALEDGLRLAAGMTRKLAVLGLPCGGGKAVLAVPELPRGDERRRLFERYAELIESLGGGYVTGPDVNTGEADMDVIGEPPTTSSAAASATAARATRASTRRSASSTASARRSRTRSEPTTRPAGPVLVQGTGSVGAKLARLLLDAGAIVLVSDVDGDRARATGGRPVDPDNVLELECDVYAPCALGATLNADSIPRLRCRVVAGGANNQLATPEDGERLRAAGILYAPDYVINGGGALHGIGSSTSAGTTTGSSGRSPGSAHARRDLQARRMLPESRQSEAAERLAAERLARAAQELRQ